MASCKNNSSSMKMLHTVGCILLVNTKANSAVYLYHFPPGNFSATCEKLSDGLVESE